MNTKIKECANSLFFAFEELDKFFAKGPNASICDISFGIIY